MGMAGMPALLAAALSAAAASGADAQTLYRCNNGGSTYVSDRPCGPGLPGKLGVIGPVPERRNTPAPTYHPPVAKAPDHLPYLSPACASINDAIRTAPARGLRSAAIQELHQEYRQKCDEDEQAAQQRFSQEKMAQRNERRAQQAAQESERARLVADRERCHELLRILHGKRKQLETMNAGEKADFERFEASYNSRCKAM